MLEPGRALDAERLACHVVELDAADRGAREGAVEQELDRAIVDADVSERGLRDRVLEGCHQDDSVTCCGGEVFERAPGVFERVAMSHRLDQAPWRTSEGARRALYVVRGGVLGERVGERVHRVQAHGAQVQAALSFEFAAGDEDPPRAASVARARGDELIDVIAGGHVRVIEDDAELLSVRHVEHVGEHLARVAPRDVTAELFVSERRAQRAADHVEQWTSGRAEFDVDDRAFLLERAVDQRRLPDPPSTPDANAAVAVERALEPGELGGASEEEARWVGESVAERDHAWSLETSTKWRPVRLEESSEYSK